MPRQKDYVEKLANNIEQKLDMDSGEISDLSRGEFGDLLRNGYFAQKLYANRQTEPTTRQLDVLSLHYGIPLVSRRFQNVSHKYYNVSYRTEKTYYPDVIRKNVRGRYIDAKTGRFVSIKN